LRPFFLQDFTDRYEGRYRDVKVATGDPPGLTMAFQRRKPAAIGVQAPYPRHRTPLATSIERVPSDIRCVRSRSRPNVGT
jgi:hypothetical protein